MKVLIWIGVGIGGLLVIGAVFIFVSLFYLSRNQPSPAELSLGVSGGELAACPETPNCVSTQAPESDELHRAEPISYAVTRAEMRQKILGWIREQPNSEVVAEEESYIHAVFASSIFGFKDDLEVYLPEGEGLVHLRSAARVGRGDMGVNRKRYEAIRHALE